MTVADIDTVCQFVAALLLYILIAPVESYAVRGEVAKYVHLLNLLPKVDALRSCDVTGLVMSYHARLLHS